MNENETREKQVESVAEHDCRNKGDTSFSPYSSVEDGEKITMDYMAKDYTSFRNALLDLIPARIPQWVDRSEADMGIMLVELFSHIADDLSYFQDRVANEAFLRTAIQRSSVKGHLNLIDYHLHNGISAIVFIKIRASQSGVIPAGFQFSTNVLDEQNRVIFETVQDQYVDVMHNEMNLLDMGIDDVTGHPYALLEKRFAKLQKAAVCSFRKCKRKC